MAAVNLERARAAWSKLPDWVRALADACDATSQGAIGKRLGVSPSVVNQVLGNRYAGRVDLFEKRVRGELMAETVLCPILGDLSSRDCLDHQSRKFSATNPVRVKLFTACKTCPNRKEAAQ